MRNGTFYARRVKRLFSELRKRHEPPKVPEPSDPVDQLVLALLSYDTPFAKAARAAQALLETMVDYNDVRVSTKGEIAAVIHPYVFNSPQRADAIRRALNAVFRKEHRINLQSLHKLGRREARQYLEELDGVDSHAMASVLLWSLGGHAVPVDRRLYEALREEGFVEPSATIEEVQAFLDRNTGASDAKEFCLLMRQFVDARGSRSKARGTDASTKRTAAPKTSPREKPDTAARPASKKTRTPAGKRPTSRRGPPSP